MRGGEERRKEPIRAEQRRRADQSRAHQSVVFPRVHPLAYMKRASRSLA